MPRDDQTSVYLVRDGRTEVVRLDDERRARARSESGPVPKGTTSRDSIEPTSPPAAPVGATHVLAAQLVDEIAARAPGDVSTVLGRLLLHFEYAEPLFIERFPGPLWADPRQMRNGAVRGHAISAMSACLIALGESGSPTVLKLMSSTRPEQRACAAYTARELPFAPIVAKLFELAIHDDPSARLAAVTVLPELSHAPSFDEHLISLRRSASFGPTTIRLRAIQAIEELRDSAYVPMLVATLGHDDVELVDAASAALRAIAARDFGRLRWSIWLRTNQTKPRFAWLVDALDQRDPALRRHASLELGRLTGHDHVLALEATRSDVDSLIAHYRNHGIARRPGGPLR